MASKRPAADQVLDRIVAEQAQMSGSAAGRDAGGDRIHAALNAVSGQGVQIGGLGGLQFGRSARLDGQSAQAVGHEHHDFRLVGDLQVADQLLDIHASGSFIFQQCLGRMFHGNRRRCGRTAGEEGGRKCRTIGRLWTFEHAARIFLRTAVSTLTPSGPNHETTRSHRVRLFRAHCAERSFRRLCSRRAWSRPT